MKGGQQQWDALSPPRILHSTSVLQGAAAVGNRELAGSPNWFPCFIWQRWNVAVGSTGRENYSKQKTVVCHKPGSRAVTHFPLALLTVRWISATSWPCWALIEPSWMNEERLICERGFLQETCLLYETQTHPRIVRKQKVSN